jgi:hypothetical protein
MVFSTPEVSMRIVAMLLVLLTAQITFAGGIGNARSMEVLGAIGLRAKQPLSGDARVGELVPAVVVDPTKLAAHGLKGLKQGDEVTLKIAPGGKFSLQSQKRSLSFAVNDRGQVVKGQMAR